MSHPELNRVVGYAENAVPQDFRILDQEKSDRAFAGLFPPSLVREPEVTPVEFEAAARAFDGELDRAVVATARVEQAYLRRQLFDDRPTGTCAVCGRELPTDLLVAAHVKRRAACDAAERLDIPNNVMAACGFGYDDLYERGYLAVEVDGAVVTSPAVPDQTSALGRRLAEVRGRRCAAFSEASRDYFAWHRAHVFRYTPPALG